MCLVTNQTTACENNIPITNSTEWSEKLRSYMSFFLITFDGQMTDHDLERGFGLRTFVLQLSESDFQKKIIPAIESNISFSINCSRMRNCEVIKDSYYLYPIAISIYIVLIVRWIYSLKQSPNEMLTPQKILNALFILKCYCDIALLYHILQCKPTGYIEGADYIMHDVKNLLRPVFEGLLIYFLLALSLVFFLDFKRK